MLGHRLLLFPKENVYPAVMGGFLLEPFFQERFGTRATAIGEI